MTRKGVVFSMDALLAAIALSIFVASLAFLSSSSAEESHGQFLAKKQAGDLLMAMDKSGLLGGMKQDSINGTLSAALPPDTGYLLEIRYYNYSDGFEMVNSTSLARGNGSDDGKAGVSQRDFVAIRQGNTPLFGVARLTIWKGS
ncbi:MAG: hypothetical protein WC717_05085 [Candidatus Micrarchaeia archaeon]|jgi:hypothetical protein